MKTNSLSAWILAVRPYSLGNSVILVLIASALAYTDGGFRPGTAGLCLLFALLMQCTDLSLFWMIFCTTHTGCWSFRNN